MGRAQLYIVDASVLPEVFLKVSEAKEYLLTGRARTVSEAATLVGISRSAFYKYKDAITPFRDVKRDQIVTMGILTRDHPGALSSVLTIFAESGANILTIHQSIPSNGAGLVTISFTGGEGAMSLEALRGRLEELPAVMRIEFLAG